MFRDAQKQGGEWVAIPMVELGPPGPPGTSQCLYVTLLRLPGASWAILGLPVSTWAILGSNSIVFVRISTVLAMLH